MNYSIVALVLTLPAPALGQALKSADLVGTWVSVEDGQKWGDSLKGQIVASYLTLGSDGTFRTDQKKNGQGWGYWGITGSSTGEKPDPNNPHGVQGFWSLLGDTVKFGIYDGYKPGVERSGFYPVRLKDQQLFFWNIGAWDVNRREEKCATYAFQRFDSLKPLTLPPPLPVTMKEADVVGTWVAAWGTMDSRPETDTLTLGSGGVATLARVRSKDKAPAPSVTTENSKGTWRLDPGDWVVVQIRQNPGMNSWFMLHDQRLVTCDGSVYKRVAP